MLEKFERYPLMFGTTPIEKLNRLSRCLGGSVEIYAKRDDCNSGLAFGGNKIRKLEYIVPDAIASEADTLVTIGGIQSNHTRQVAAVAAKLGMKCHLVQENWVPFQDAVYDRVGNILMSRVMGAEIEFVDEGFDIGIRQSWERALENLKARGARPYAIPAGASMHKYGGLGYVGFAEEVRDQEATMGIRFDFIIVCTVTGSTHAGMLVGFAKDGRARNVIPSTHPARFNKPGLRCWRFRNTPPTLLNSARTSQPTISSSKRTILIPPMASHRRRPMKQFGCAVAWKE